MLVQGNPDADVNSRAGGTCARNGTTDPDAVKRAYDYFERGTASGYWFREGYREAAGRKGMSREQINAALAKVPR